MTPPTRETWDPTTPAGDERRLTVRIIRYWNECRGMRTMPEENDIDPDALGADWDYCFLLQVRDLVNVQDYNFTYLGTRIAQAYFDTALDQYNEFVVGPNASCLSHHFKQVIETEAPLIDNGEFMTIHANRVLYRQVLLPLGNEDAGVVSIFGAMNYKIDDT